MIKITFECETAAELRTELVSLLRSMTSVTEKSQSLVDAPATAEADKPAPKKRGRPRKTNAQAPPEPKTEQTEMEAHFEPGPVKPKHEPEVTAGEPEPAEVETPKGSDQEVLELALDYLMMVYEKDGGKEKIDGLLKKFDIRSFRDLGPDSGHDLYKEAMILKKEFNLPVQ